LQYIYVLAFKIFEKQDYSLTVNDFSSSTFISLNENNYLLFAIKNSIYRRVFKQQEALSLNFGGI
jgi:hypothetical protein